MTLLVARRAPDLAVAALLLEAAAALPVIGLLRSRRTTRPATTAERESDHVSA